MNHTVSEIKEGVKEKFVELNKKLVSVDVKFDEVHQEFNEVNWACKII